ncbi:unnamed protein product, partial [Prunus brigantina]
MGNARQREPRPRSAPQANSQVTVLTSRVAELEGQMSVILQSLLRSGIPIPNFGASTSETGHPEHPQQTTAPVDPQIPEPHMPDDHTVFRRAKLSSRQVLRRTVLRDEVNHLVVQSLSSLSLRD